MNTNIKTFLIRNKVLLIIIAALWIAAMALQKVPAKTNIFWFPLVTNIIVGIPVGLLTGWIASALFSDMYAAKRYQRAHRFYSKFVGEFQEWKVVTKKQPTLQWKSLTVTQDGLDLIINFNDRVDDPTNLKATMRLYGTEDCKTIFEAAYVQDSANDYDEGYWGKYDISLYDDAMRGHKSHTGSHSGDNGRVEYIITRIIWKRITTKEIES